LRHFHSEHTTKKFHKKALVKNGGVGHFFWAGVLTAHINLKFITSKLIIYALNSDCYFVQTYSTAPIIVHDGLDDEATR
jgi:hypothetical protein